MVNISFAGYRKRRNGEPQNTVLELKNAERTNWTGIIGVCLARDREYRLTKWKTGGETKDAAFWTGEELKELLVFVGGCKMRLLLNRYAH
jgi:hypothetical protein